MAEWFAWIPTAYLISEWAIRIGMTPFVVRRRTSTSAMAWLLIIYFLPWAGFILYGMLGQRRLGRRRLQRYADARKRIETPVRMAAQEIHVVHPSLPPDGIPGPMIHDLAYPVCSACRVGFGPVDSRRSLDLPCRFEDLLERGPIRHENR